MINRTILLLSIIVLIFAAINPQFCSIIGTKRKCKSLYYFQNV